MSIHPAALSVQDLCVSYGALHALRDVSWECRRGEILGLIGPNGAGKSTCFEATTHTVSRRGRVLLGGEDVSRLPARDLALRGLRRAFQQNAFFGGISVLENMMGVLLHRYGTPLAVSVFMPWAERQRRCRARDEAATILERFAVPRRFHDDLPADIPYGVQRMLSVALAYGDGADVLLLDEPAAGLGGNDMARLSELMLQLRASGVALVVVEHHMDLIMAVADRIVALNQGTVLATGTPEEVRRNPQVQDAYLGGVPS